MIDEHEREMLTNPEPFIDFDEPHHDEFIEACQTAMRYIDDLEHKAAEYQTTIDRLRANWPRK